MSSIERTASVFWVVVLLMVSPLDVIATGISVDAGLTPPEGRWIIRTQYRTMSRKAPGSNPESSMRRQVVPLVVVYGLRPELTLGLRQTFEIRSMSMAGADNEVSGLGDLHIFAKYKALRINTRTHVIGISPMLAVEPPTGADGITSNAWDLFVGLFFSGRAGAWGIDMDLLYAWNGFAGVAADQADPGDEVGVYVAFAYQISLGGSGRAALAPVLEASWQDVSPSTSDEAVLPNSGEYVFSLAPGLKYTLDDLILEGLIRFPVTQRQEGLQMEAGVMALLGVRHMF